MNREFMAEASSTLGNAEKRFWRHFTSVLVGGPLVVLAFGGPAFGMEEGIRELRLPEVVVDSEPGPEMGFEVPPPGYPLHPIDQIPFQGSRHGFVNTSAGNLVFRMWDMRLPGRMPIEMGRAYNSGFSPALPPFTVPGPYGTRYTHDLGPNWILGYSAYLVEYQSPSDGYTLAYFPHISAPFPANLSFVFSSL